MLNFLTDIPVVSNFEPYTLLLPIALILIFAKIFAIICKKIGLPQVIGFLLSGLFVGLIILIPGQTIFNYETTNQTGGTLGGLDDLAKIGVVLIMFSAGMETDLRQIKASGLSSLVITLLGVLVPFGLGAGIAFAFFPTNEVWTNLFYGVILTATSVSITVAVVKELGRLETKVGSAIISAAILDDIIGIIFMSLIIGLGKSGSTTESVLPFNLTTNNTGLDIFCLILFMVGFFVFAIGAGIVIRLIFKWLDKKWPVHRRLPIFALGVCFLYSYVAEMVFGVADITGAYIAGIIIGSSSQGAKTYIDNRAEIPTNYLFGPIFFANIGLMMFKENLDFSDYKFVIFGILFVILGMLGKVIGCGGGALLTKSNFKDSLKIGIGMMARAEVVIVTASKGITVGLIEPNIMPFILILIIATSFLTPIFLKLLYKNDPPVIENKELSRN